MTKGNDHKNRDDKEVIDMITIANQRPCTISESIIQSCKEVKSMREGKTPKHSLDELFSNVEKWVTEENDECAK